MQIFMKDGQKQLYLDALYYHLIGEGYSKWMAKKTVEQQRMMMIGKL